MRPSARKRSVLCVVAIGLSLGSVDLAYRARRQTSDTRGKGTVRQGVCEREAEKLIGQKPVRIGRSVRAPKRLRHVQPTYPELPPGTIASGMWLGEVLIDTSGKIARIWPIREVEFKPPFPAFNTAISDAIKHWKYEPLLVEGAPRPACMTVTVNINWQ